jgi:hypothetical protein
MAPVFSEEGLGPTELRERLRQGGVGVIEHRNEAGYLYGLHYLNEGSGQVFKASEVGKKFTAAVWRGREQTDQLAEGVRRELAKELKRYMATRAVQLGLRSAAVRQVSLRELQDHLAQAGYQLREVTPYLKAFKAAEEKEYPKLLQRDRATMTTLQRGIERLRPEYRRAVLEAAGMVVTATGSQHRHNADIQLKPTRGVAAAAPGSGERIGPLSRQERILLLQIGRNDGVGTLAQSVHLGNLDWPGWRERLPPKRAEALEERLRRNYLQSELQKAGRRRKPIDYLIGRGVIVEPAKSGYRAYRYDAPDQRVGLTAAVAARIAESGYTVEDFRKIKLRTEDSTVKQLYRRAESLEKAGLRNNSGNGSANRAKKGKRKLPSDHLRTQISGWIQSSAPRLYQQGLYDLLVNTDQEEDPAVRRQRYQRRLSD